MLVICILCKPEQVHVLIKISGEDTKLTAVTTLLFKHSLTHTAVQGVGPIGFVDLDLEQYALTFESINGSEECFGISVSFSPKSE